MSKVYPRRRSQDPTRPGYLPTSIQERLSQPHLPEENMTSWDKRRLEGRGIDVDFINALVPDVTTVKMELPPVPVKTTTFQIYRPGDENS